MTGERSSTHEQVRSTYAEIAETDEGSSCCSPRSIYTADQLAAIPEGAELGLGTGNPVEAAAPEPGDTVVDLGSGAGVDVFLAADAVGPSGRAIGIDITPEMVERARSLADEAGIENVSFHRACIEDVPLADDSADVVVSNCVINLAPDKTEVLEEAYRLLAPGGRLVVSDPVCLDDPAGPTTVSCGCDCSDGALSPATWRRLLADVGFTEIETDAEEPDGRFGPAVGTALVEATKPE